MVALPFDINADIIEIADRDYALFYRDLVDEPAKYEGKTVRYKGLCANNMRMPKDTFLAGRHIMTCCEADIAYCPLVCRWDMAKSVKHKSWGIVEGRINVKFSNIYGKKGPVITVHSFAPATEPEPAPASARYQDAQEDHCVRILWSHHDRSRVGRCKDRQGYWRGEEDDA